MTVFGEAIAFFKGDPYFHLLYVGGSSSHARAFREWAASHREVAKFAEARDLDEAKQVFKRESLRVGRYAGCLMVICDLDASVDVAADQIESLGFDGQTVFFLLSGNAQLFTFEQRTSAVASGVLFAGNPEDCLKTLTGLCNPSWPPSSRLSLRQCFAKNPGRWIRSFHHDYLGGNFVLNCVELLRSNDLVAMQKDLFFLQNILLNLLIFPFHTHHADFTVHAHEGPSPLAAELEKIRVRLFVPESLAHLFTGAEYNPEICLDYDRFSELPTIDVDEPAILVLEPKHNGSEIPANLSRFAQVWITRSPVTLTWQGWQQAFSRRVIAAYTTDQFTGDRQSPPPFMKMAYWRATAFMPLGEIFPRIQDLLERTYDALRPCLDLEDLLPVFMAWMEMRNAQALYLVDSVANNKFEEIE